MIVKLCNASDLPAPGEMRAFQGRGLELCVARPRKDPSRFFVFDNRCPHANAMLSEGSLDGNEVVCPLHGWRYDIGTGYSDVAGDPPLKTYEAREHDDAVFVQIP